VEHGDIGVYSSPGQACIFEGLLASPPPKKRNLTTFKYERNQKQDKWDVAIQSWTANELPLKSLINHVKRLGISTDVITFLSPEAVDPIYNWLLRKGVVTNVFYYVSPEAYAEDLKYDHSIRSVYVPDQSMARILGMRSTTTSPTTTWGF
jgi:hypothetical protein